MKVVFDLQEKRKKESYTSISFFFTVKFLINIFVKNYSINVLSHLSTLDDTDDVIVPPLILSC